MYRKDSYQTLVDDYNFFMKKNIHFGNKMVRGHTGILNKKMDIYLQRKKKQIPTTINLFFSIRK